MKKLVTAGLFAGFVFAVSGCKAENTDNLLRDGTTITKDEARNMGKTDWLVDHCAENNWYNDGECDDFCLEPDPDCGVDLERDKIDEFKNNLDVVLISDPMILKDGDSYYLYATAQDTCESGFKVWQSEDMVNWRYKGMCFEKSNYTWSAHDFWAPECVKAGSTYYLYYSARDDALFSQRRICVASSTSPLGPFTEVAAPMFDDGSDGNIDAHVFQDGDGTKYMYYAKEVWGDGAFAENQTWVVTMDSYTSTLTDYTFCIKATEGWEKKSYLGAVRWNEAPWVLKKNSTYYLMFSANCFDTSDYCVGYATSDSPKGPWIKYGGNPVLQKTASQSGPGHHCIVNSADGQMWIGYHTHVGDGGGDRQLNIDKINWSGNTLVVNGPTSTPQAYPDGAYVYSGSTDYFDDSTLDSKWIVVSEDPSKWSIRSDPGCLVITAQDGETYEDRHDYGNMFLQHAPDGDFFVYTEVQMSTTSKCEQASIYVWQDDDNYIRMSKGYLGFWGSQEFEAVKEENGSPSSWTASNNMGDTVKIGIQKIGNTYTCSYWNNSQWELVGSSMTASFFPIKIGITAMSPGSGAAKTASFKSFILSK